MAVLITRPTIRQKVLEELGGYVTTMTSASTTTSIVLNDFKNRFADNNALKNFRVYFPDDAAADMERYFTAWDDSTAAGTVEALSGAPAADSTVELYAPSDPTHHEINRAINRSLQELRRPTWTALPTRQGARRYGLTELPWVRDRFDVLSVNYRDSPNLLNNEDFEYWGTGANAALTSWTLAGSGSTVDRAETVHAHGPYAATINGAANPTTLTQTIGLLDRQLIGETIDAEVMCLASSGSVAQLRVTDGVTTADSGYHTGGGVYERLAITAFEVSSSATTLTFQLRHEAATGASSWSRAILLEGSTIPTWLQDYGSENASVSEIRHSVVNTPDGAAIVLNSAKGRKGQIWVQSLMPYPELDSETATTDCPLEAVMALTLTHLARRRRNENQERWDEVLGMWAPAAQRWQRRQRARATVSQQQIVVQGA